MTLALNTTLYTIIQDMNEQKLEATCVILVKQPLQNTPKCQPQNKLDSFHYKLEKLDVAIMYLTKTWTLLQQFKLATSACKHNENK